MGAGATLGGSEDDRRHCPFIVPFLVASRMLASRPSARRARLQPSGTCALHPCASSDAQHERRCCTQVQRLRR